VTEPLEGNTTGASKPDTVSTNRERIATLAKQSPEMAFTSLNHYLDFDWFLRACILTRKDGATGVDGQTYEDYREELRINLESLLERAKSGSYQAPPVRRAYIPKGDGKETRPIGIPTLEDKILQRAVVMLLDAIYEQDFHEGSYGFRPGRSAHQALDDLRETLMHWDGGWVYEVDIRKCFDTLSHFHLREFLQRRIRDGVVLRLIGKWLRAGVMEDGTIHYPEVGSPQGGCISPLLANVYLHYVLDEWFEQEVKPRLLGPAKLIRYADDFVLIFRNESDAKRVADVLGKRFAKYGLALHPDKTRLVPFRRPPLRPGAGSKIQTPGTFDLLGFTVYWGRTLRGGQAVKFRTAASRLRRVARAFNLWCRTNRHLPIPEQHEALKRKLIGHYRYFGRPSNSSALVRMLRLVRRLWHKWLSRRSWAGFLSWQQFNRILQRYPLPFPRINVPAPIAGKPGA
jgi:RNA-directed DNA polymerase